jgi:hypothetical protein
VVLAVVTLSMNLHNPLNDSPVIDRNLPIRNLKFVRRCQPIATACLMLALLLSLPSNLSRADETSVTQETAKDQTGDALYFEDDIRPILREYCLDCHGATDDLKGSLDLRLVRFMNRGGDSGPALTDQNPDASLLIQRVESDDMPPGEIKVSAEKKVLLRRWIAAGAPTNRPEPESIGAGIPLTESERNYWAYQPLEKPALSFPTNVPSTDPSNPVQPAPAGTISGNGIDVLLQQAMPTGLTFSPIAPRSSLIRRVYLDLIGIPPTQTQFKQWMEVPDADWYEQMVEELLQSKQYGERWARHWLDAVGYADSDGATLADAERTWAWRYRDYVIESFNNDKPFDRFILEQLAGDELAGPANGDWTPEQIQTITATGFLRMTADGTGSGDNSPEARNKTIADTLQVIGNTLLGSSLQCAQCHDHRYDPISHEDYFAIRAVFDPALDWQQWKTPNERLVSLTTQAERDASAQIEIEAQLIATEKSSKEAEYIKQALDQELMKFEEPLRSDLRSAYETQADKRSPEQKALLDKNPSVNISPGVLYQYLPAAADELKKFDTRIAEARAKKPAESFLHALTEPAGHLPATKLFHRGDHNQPTREIAPAKLSVLVPEGTDRTLPIDDPAIPTSGRRLAFAKWLTDPKTPNPLFVRSLVNRIWMHHFGKGIVNTPSDFGKLGSLPSHPKLLDWLGWELIEHNWSLKHLHRVILTSVAYRQSSVRSPSRESIDPDNRYYSRKDIARVDAEVLRDSLLALSGSLSTDLYGPPMALQEDDAGQVRVDPAQSRRSIYAKWRRSQPVAMLQSFDAPVMGVLCDTRTNSTVATQSLMLMNGEFALEQASKIAKICMDTQANATANPPATATPGTTPDLFTWELPSPPPDQWVYATGKLSSDSTLVESFSPLATFQAGQWQGSTALPDPTIGWVLLHAQGGHPGNKNYPAIRRWIAPKTGKLEVRGKLGHGSENGDGVFASILTKRGSAGSWSAKATTVDTLVVAIDVEQGDAVDFVVQCGEHETSDSFTWPITLVLSHAEGTLTVESTTSFRGPSESRDRLAHQIHIAWNLILRRDPTQEEIQALKSFVGRQLEILYRDPQRVPPGSSPTQQVLVNVCQMLINSNEFLYID